MILFFFMLYSCKKEKPAEQVAQEISCEPFPYTPVTWYTQTGMQYKNPCFNPNNHNEFVYNEYNLDTQAYDVVKYNMVTKQKSILASQVRTVGIPRWSSAGWIAFDNLFDEQIWMVKETGDSLHQVSQSNLNRSPCWRNDGRTLYWLNRLGTASPYLMLKQKAGSLHTDTIIAEYTYNLDISSTNKFATEYYIGNTGYIAFADIDHITEGLHDLKPTGEINLMQICWSHDSQYIYFLLYQKGLYRLHVNTGNCKQVMKFCSNSYYQTIACSADGKSLIGERTDCTMSLSQGVPTGQIMKKSSIYIVNLYNMQEIKVEL